MVFEKGHLYHIYNQGNNRQKIFFNEKNYHFFIRKIDFYILPYADILAWCLMPNHFHLMVLVNEIQLNCNTQGFTTSEALSIAGTKKRSLNDSIGIMLRTYTRAINKQEGFTGSLFRKETKAKCLNCLDEKLPYFLKQNNSCHYPINSNKEDYPQICFDYIHQNPVTSNLVKNTHDWEYSSAQIYAGLRKPILINKSISNKYLNF